MSLHACNIVILVSGTGSNLQAIIDNVQSGDLPGKITGVISNRPDATGLNKAQAADIPTAIVDHRLFDSREAFDAELAKNIHHFGADLVVLAGFMRILTPGFVTRFSGKMLNIHPSLLPKYRGLHTHQRALDAGDQRHGASVHFVTPELDGGPVIAQASIPILKHDTADTLASRLLQQEHRLYPQVIRWFCEGRLSLIQNQAFLDKAPLTNPKQLGNDPLHS